MQCSRSNIARATSHGVDGKGVAKAEGKPGDVFGGYGTVTVSLKKTSDEGDCLRSTFFPCDIIYPN